MNDVLLGVQTAGAGVVKSEMEPLKVRLVKAVTGEDLRHFERDSGVLLEAAYGV